MSREYVDKYLEETQEIVKRISREEIVKAAGMRPMQSMISERLAASRRMRRRTTFRN